MPSPFPVEDWYPNFEAIRRSIKQPLSDAAEDAITAIRRRTTEGRDRFGRQFEPYAPFTRRKKALGGRPIPAQPVTLVRTGGMLNSLRKFPIRNGFRIRPTGARNVSLGLQHQRGFPPTNLPARQWFGLSPSQRRRLSAKHGRRILQNVSQAAVRNKGGSLSIDFVV